MLDLGLGAWRDGERFLVEYRPEPAGSEEPPGLRVLAGDDGDLADLRRGRTAGTVVHDGFQHLVLLQQEGAEGGFVLSAQASGSAAGADSSKERDHRSQVAGRNLNVPGPPPRAVASLRTGVTNRVRRS